MTGVQVGRALAGPPGVDRAVVVRSLHWLRVAELPRPCTGRPGRRAVNHLAREHFA